MKSRLVRRAVESVVHVMGSIPWIAPSLLNSWVNYGGATVPTAGYYKDHWDIVHLRGVVKDGAVPSTVFTLPAGYRPAYEYHFAAMSNDLPQGYLRIEPDGDVVAVAGSNVWFSLACSFRAEA